MATVSFHSGATSGGQVAMNPTPANVAVATTSNYVNSATLLAAASDGSNLLAKRDVDEQLIKRYGNQGITGLMELLGTKKETTQQKFEHYEETFLHNAFDASIGSTGDFTIANSFDDAGDGSGNTALRDGDIIMGGSGALYYVNAADAAQPNNDFTIKNVSNGTRATSGSDTKFCIVGNAYAERTDQPGEGITPRVIQYSNRCQIIIKDLWITANLQ
jgi:hypothetical protein